MPASTNDAELHPTVLEHIDELAHKYHDGPYENPIQSERVMLRIAPLHQLIFA